MGQRSHITIRYHSPDKPDIFLSRYYQWNWGRYMGERISQIIEYFDYYNSNQFSVDRNRLHDNLLNLLESNFTNRSVVETVDLIGEHYCEMLSPSPMKAVDLGDPGDGQVYIDVEASLDAKHRPRYAIKYCFVDYSFYASSTATRAFGIKEYMKMYESRFTKKITSLCDAIDKMASIMTDSECENFGNICIPEENMDNFSLINSLGGIIVSDWAELSPDKIDKQIRLFVKRNLPGKIDNTRKLLYILSRKSNVIYLATQGINIREIIKNTSILSANEKSAFENVLLTY